METQILDAGFRAGGAPRSFHRGNAAADFVSKDERIRAKWLAGRVGAQHLENRAQPLAYGNYAGRVRLRLFGAQDERPKSAAAIDLHITPLEAQKLANPAACRERRDDQCSQVGRGCSEEFLLFTRLQSPFSDRLSGAVQADNVDAVSLEGSVVAIALSDGPIEKVSDACFESVEANLSAFGTPAGQRCTFAQLRRNSLSGASQLGDLTRSLASLVDGRQSTRKDCIQIRAGHSREHLLVWRDYGTARPGHGRLL